MSIKVCIVDNTCIDCANLPNFVFGEREYSRIDNIKNSRRKSESLAALAALGQITDDIADRCIERDGFGRPYFKNAENSDFSISHSGNLSVAACIDGGSRLGVDIELIKEKDNSRIADRFFTEKEKALLDGMRNNDGFYMIWTAKEAKAKKLGTGLSKLLSENCHLAENGDALLHFFVEYKGSRYMLTICVDREEKVEFFCGDNICVNSV